MSTPDDLPLGGADSQLGALVSDRVVAEVLRKQLSTSVYLQCASLTRFTIHDLDARGSSPEELATALSILTARGLISRLDDDTWITLPPDQALGDQATRLEEQAATIRAAAPSLARVYYDARTRERSGDREVGVELLDNLDDVNSAMAELFGGARKYIYSMRTDSPRVQSMMRRDPDQVNYPMVNSTGDTLHLRVTFDTKLLGNQGLPEIIARRLRIDDIRFANNVPFTATASDTGVTVMDLQKQTAGSVGVRITHPDVSAAIRKVIDNIWVHGMKWAGLGSVTPEQRAPLDPRDREILGLMVGGAADATIARQVGISQRTVERRVRRILELLDATTRFQAGVQAARRGWV
jgi:DNA-binding CsgD family transcriptional regulator